MNTLTIHQLSKVHPGLVLNDQGLVEYRCEKCDERPTWTVESLLREGEFNEWLASEYIACHWDAHVEAEYASARNSNKKLGFGDNFPFYDGYVADDSKCGVCDGETIHDTLWAQLVMVSMITSFANEKEMDRLEEMEYVPVCKDCQPQFNRRYLITFDQYRKRYH